MLSFNQVVSNQLDWEEDMKFYDEYLSKIDDQGHRMVLETVLNWVSDNYPNLGGKIAWNQPMFTDHGTFIIAFSIAKNNFAFTPEAFTLAKFKSEIEKAGYSYTDNIIRIPYDAKIDFELIGKMIDFNIQDKQGYTKFFR